MKKKSHIKDDLELFDYQILRTSNIAFNSTHTTFPTFLWVTTIEMNIGPNISTGL